MTVFNSILTLGFENVSSTIKVEIPKVVQEIVNMLYDQGQARSRGRKRSRIRVREPY